jgi:hypothetical protein
MQVSDLIKVLGLVGEGYRSKDGLRPADAVERILTQLRGSENLTIEAWIALRRKPKPQPQKVCDRSLGDILLDLEGTTATVALEAAYQRLDSLSLTSSQIKDLAKLATGKGTRSKEAAIIALKTYLASRAQSQERKLSVSRAFS